MYVLKMLFDQHSNNGNELVAVTIDEGIKGYRDESLQIVKDFCATWYRKQGPQLPVSLWSGHGSGDDPAIITKSIILFYMWHIPPTCNRYAAEAVGADIVATAHNMDDQLQTFMINLLAGDVERIGWIYPEPVQYTQSGMKKSSPL